MLRNSLPMPKSLDTDLFLSCGNFSLCKIIRTVLIICPDNKLFIYLKDINSSHQCNVFYKSYCSCLQDYLLLTIHFLGWWKTAVPCTLQQHSSQNSGCHCTHIWHRYGLTKRSRNARRTVTLWTVSVDICCWFLKWN